MRILHHDDDGHHHDKAHKPISDDNRMGLILLAVAALASGAYACVAYIGALG